MFGEVEVFESESVGVGIEGFGDELGEEGADGGGGSEEELVEEDEEEGSGFREGEEVRDCDGVLQRRR